MVDSFVVFLGNELAKARKKSSAIYGLCKEKGYNPEIHPSQNINPSFSNTNLLALSPDAEDMLGRLNNLPESLKRLLEPVSTITEPKKDRFFSYGRSGISQGNY